MCIKSKIRLQSTEDSKRLPPLLWILKTNARLQTWARGEWVEACCSASAASSELMHSRT